MSAVSVQPSVAAPSAAEESAAWSAASAAGADERWQQLQWLPCHLEVQLTVPGLTVGDIIRLTPRVVVETEWQQNADVPIRANGQLIAWAEFEGVDEKLAVRVTRLA